MKWIRTKQSIKLYYPSAQPFTPLASKTVPPLQCGVEKEKVKKKDTLQQLLDKLQVSVPVLRTVDLGPMPQDFLISRLVLVAFRQENTLYMLEGIDMHKLLLDFF